MGMDSFGRAYMIRTIAVTVCLISGLFAAGAAGAADTIMNTGQNPVIGPVGSIGLPSLRSMSLLDPERFSMRHQYIVSYGSGGGMGNSSLMGMYINTMEYRFNAPIIMRMNVAYQAGTANLFGGGGKTYAGMDQSGQVYVPSAEIIYQPFKNTVISIQYRDMRGRYGNGSSPYGYNPYGSRRFGW